MQKMETKLDVNCARKTLSYQIWEDKPLSATAVEKVQGSRCESENIFSVKKANRERFQ